ncbi:unnamed protein product [Clonostachys rhizophaga]|uniref:Uncharacterized protein n=1 Tax=Clonostachys rhizophaga TaxID=160324 RepID=A0A9N9YBY0_9HYPO|nr:unnamed protein product [Clonostachys rhizophaga]
MSRTTDKWEWIVVCLTSQTPITSSLERMEGGNSSDSRDKWNIQRPLEEVARDPGLEGPACK